MKWKLLLIVGVLSVTFMSIVIWRTDRIVYADRITWVESQARSQVMAINKAIEAEMHSVLRLSGSVSIEALKADKNQWKNLSPYFALASAVIGQQGQLQIQNFVVKEKSAAATWTPDSLEKWLTGMKSSRAKVGDVLIRPISDSAKNRFIVAVVFESENAKIFVSSNEFLLSLIDTHKGSLGQVMIVSEDGIILSHSTAEYVGTSAVDDPVVKELKKTGSPQGVGEYPSDEGNIFGYFERVKSTNLYTVMTATEAMIANGRKAQALQFLMMGLGLILFSFAGVLLVMSPYEKGFKKITNHISQLLKSEGDSAETKAWVVDSALPRELFEIDELIRSVEVKSSMLGRDSLTKKNAPVFAASEVSENQSGKMQAYKQIAEALGHEMKSPLIAVLGYAQVIESLSQESKSEEEIRRLASQLLTEARAARLVMEKLFSFAGGLNETTREVSADVPVRNVLAKLDSYLREHSIEVHFDVAANLPKMKMAPDSIMKAIEAIVMNSVQAMERMPKKVLNVSIRAAADNSVDIEIQDSGEGISQENLPKVFDPFFTTRSYAHHLGMGLSMAYGIFKEHGGQVSVQSSQGQAKGTKLQIHLPNLEKQAQQSEIKLPEKILPVTNETLEKHYVEKSEEVQQQMKNSDSPLQVDIGAFLDLPPEVPNHEAVVGNQEQKFDSIFAASVEPSSDEDKTEIIAPKEKIAEEPARPSFSQDAIKRSSARMEFSTEMNDELTFIDGFLDDQIDKTIVSNVTPPATEPVKRFSKLDQFQVEIRKPGTRL